jgi:CheY-like chemotaxis protein
MAQSFRVLLVEDDDSLRCCLGEFLSSHGWEVGATATAADALQMARVQRFDFSLMDFHLPGMTGLELFQRLGCLRPLPAILMSGLASAEEAAAAQHAGFFTFLRKPLDLHRLRQSIDALIQTHFGGPIVLRLSRRPDVPPAPPTFPHTPRPAR